MRQNKVYFCDCEHEDMVRNEGRTHETWKELRERGKFL